VIDACQKLPLSGVQRTELDRGLDFCC